MRPNIKIQIYDSQGKLVPQHSPVTLTGGQSYIVNVIVINKSTRWGAPCPATLGIGIVANVDSVSLIPQHVRSQDFGAGETITNAFSMSVPIESGGKHGQVKAWIQDPSSNIINTATPLDIAITAQPVVAGEFFNLFARWEDKLTWQGIWATNNWPANKQMIIFIGIKNTGNVATEFKVIGTMIGVPAPAVSLIPGQSGSLEVPPFYAVGGTYVWQLYARNLAVEWSEKVDEVTFTVTIY